MENKTFCLSFLKSKPAGEDLISLGLYTVDTTRASLTDTLNLINSLLKSTTDHNLTALYSDCKEQYGDSVEDINTAKTCLKTESCYDQVNQIASAILDAADDCAGKGDIPLPDNNPLKKNSLVLGDLSDIIMTFFFFCCPFPFAAISFFFVSLLLNENWQIDDICSKHRNPSFCEAVLNSITGGEAEVDLASVGQSLILSTHTNAFDTLTLIHSHINKTSEVQLKQHYLTCSEHYDDALFEINEAKKSLISGDYNGVNRAASAVEKDAEACDSNPPPDPSQLPKNNKNLEDFSIIVMIVSVFLVHN
ncbi:hypothetical protein L6164_013720 [Bauhinia variegata]|uniref:Uncharacterized protein n=1 Tax=Bauhinia variegata TaxID=167791 RepID=A0ACB9NGS1_BAUVA|nr:hypothetical protein L6164_013720 [Bauhinia variegata]